MSDRPFQLTGLLLAAGHSRRFGSDKRRHRLPDGRSLLQASADGLASVCGRVLIGVRNSDTDLSDCLELREGWQLIRVDADNAGMGDTLAKLVREVLRQGNATGQLPDAVMVALGDMPFIKRDTLQKLCDVARGLNENNAAEGAKGRSRIILPIQQGQRGHPVVFSKGLLPSLSQCAGDTGARLLVSNRADCLQLIDVDDAGILRDIDEADDCSVGDGPQTIGGSQAPLAQAMARSHLT